MSVKIKIKYLALLLGACSLIIGCSPIKPPYNEFRAQKPDLRHLYLKHFKTKVKVLKNLNKEDIQYVKYGDLNTLIIPTDRYFEFNSSQFNELCYRGLLDIINLLRYYPCSKIAVGSFTDDVGSKTHKYMLSQARAEAMLTFLWANNIKAIGATGYADRYAIGDNYIMHGSAYNRRIELQWLSKDTCCCEGKVAATLSTK